MLREIQVVLKIYFNGKHSPFQFYRKTKNHYYIKKKLLTGLSDQKQLQKHICKYKL